jgi:hypothetical protein
LYGARGSSDVATISIGQADLRFALSREEREYELSSRDQFGDLVP